MGRIIKCQDVWGGEGGAPPGPPSTVVYGFIETLSGVPYLTTHTFAIDPDNHNRYAITLQHGQDGEDVVGWTGSPAPIDTYIWLTNDGSTWTIVVGDPYGLYSTTGTAPSLGLNTAPPAAALYALIPGDVPFELIDG